MNNSEFNTSQTEQLINKMSESNMVNTLINLNLGWEAVDFSSNESVIALADFISKAKSLKYVDITCQRGPRKVDM